MDAEVYVALLAIVISVVATTVTIAQTRRTEYLSRAPILVLRYDGGIGRWLVQNVGYGPALNVVVAQQSETGDEAWYNPVAIPALGVGERFVLEWLGDTGDYSLGVRYSDLRDRDQESRHFAYIRDDRCSVYPAGETPYWAMPLFSTPQARRYWEKDLPWKRSE